MFCMTINNHSNLILHKQKACGLGDISGRIMQTQIWLQTRLRYFRNNFPMIIIMKFIGHYPVIASELKDLLNHRIAKPFHTATRQRLQPGNCLGCELV
uniref:Uncharacterized protein n=1 Tax=Rhizophora mucronata TaxID=61149 RepID=A0A2P2NFM6_RHIMU